jgi:hypothetical protein
MAGLSMTREEAERRTILRALVGRTPGRRPATSIW